MSFPVITVDGPSGAGKGTVCFELAKILNYKLLDSGALYRIVGFYANREGLLNKPLNEARIAQLTKGLDIQFLPTRSGRLDILVNGENIANKIRNETVGGYASQVATLPKVRQELLDLQKNMAKASGLVADGRDMGTVVFPEADAKVYLTANAEARASRRLQQLEQNVDDETANFETILENIRKRDERDENRSTAPSKPAKDALIIDSSNLDVEAVLTKVIEFCQSKGICFNLESKIK